MHHAKPGSTSMAGGPGAHMSAGDLSREFRLAYGESP